MDTDMMHQERYQATITIGSRQIAVNLILTCNSESMHGTLIGADGRECPLTLGHVFGEKLAFRGTIDIPDEETGAPVPVPFHCYASRSSQGISGLLKSPGRSLSIVGTREAVPEPVVTAPAA